jgi:hypothetical protein
MAEKWPRKQKSSYTPCNWFDYELVLYYRCELVLRFWIVDICRYELVNWWICELVKWWICLFYVVNMWCKLQVLNCVFWLRLVRSRVHKALRKSCHLVWHDYWPFQELRLTMWRDSQPRHGFGRLRRFCLNHARWSGMTATRSRSHARPCGGMTPSHATGLAGSEGSASATQDGVARLSRAT